jgi:acetyl esterase/lipase
MSIHTARLTLLCFITLLAIFGIGNSRATGQTAPPTTMRVKLFETTPDLVKGRDTDTDPTDPTMDIYLPDPAHNTQVGIIVLPGGGYTHLSTAREGSDVGKMFAEKGIAAFVVRYRHAPRYHYPAPQQDAQRAIRTVRAKAEEYKISAQHIGVLGFSAGGHLAASVATQFDAGKPDAADAIDRVSSRPDFAVLIYPVITLTEDAYVHKGSRTALLGDDDKLWATLSPEQHVTKDTPPTFLVHGSADRAVPAENSILFYMACHKNNVPVEMHLIEKGQHGFGLAPNDPALRIWPELLMNWIQANKWVAPVKE